MEHKKRDKRAKKKVKYNVLFVPDTATADVRKFSMRLELLSTIATVVILVVVLLIIYAYFLSRDIVTLTSSMDVAKKQVQTLAEERDSLKAENAELQEKILILSDTLNEKLEEEEQKEAELAKEFVPSGFPLNGTATFEDETTGEDGNILVRFIGGEGTNVVASANGVVMSVSKNGEDNYIIIVDHQNGYHSIYINGSEPKVKEGDEVTKDTVIFTITSGNESLGYEIMQDGKNIDPMTIMEVYG